MNVALQQDIEQRLKNGDTITFVDGKGDDTIGKNIRKIVYKANRNKHKNKVRKSNKKRNVLKNR